tara:strand:+ start:152 stop:1453 length:1302 start_codon:yes stop_codon:yes gene_type:complete
LEDASRNASLLRDKFDTLDDEELRQHFEIEERLSVDANVSIKTTHAALSTEDPRPRVLEWLNTQLDETATEIEVIFANIPNKAREIGTEVSGGLLEIAEAWAPVVSTIRIVYYRGRKIIAILQGNSQTNEQKHSISAPADFDYVEVYNRLLSGRPIPEAWAPHITELDLNFEQPHHLNESEIYRVKGHPESFTDIKLLASLTALQKLNLWRAQVSDVAPLKNLTALRLLDLSQTRVADIAPLASLTTLEALYLWNTEVTDVAPLKNMTELQYLNLMGTPVHDITPLTSLTALQELDLMSTQIADISPLTRLTALQKLDLSATLVIDISPLATLTSLQMLILTTTSVADVSPLASLTNLQTLDLGSTQVADVTPLSNLAALRSLYLTNTQVADIAPLAGLTALETLEITGTRVTDVRPLNAIEDLEIISLVDAQ